MDKKNSGGDIDTATLNNLREALIDPDCPVEWAVLPVETGNTLLLVTSQDRKAIEAVNAILQGQRKNQVLIIDAGTCNP